MTLRLSEADICAVLPIAESDRRDGNGAGGILIQPSGAAGASGGGDGKRRARVLANSRASAFQESGDIVMGLREGRFAHIQQDHALKAFSGLPA
jgi:hypothetical protein